MAHIPKALCGMCNVVMQADQNGIIVEMMMGDSSKGYYKVAADTFRCPTCNHVIVTSFARVPVAEHFEEGYDRYVVDIQGRFS